MFKFVKLVKQIKKGVLKVQNYLDKQWQNALSDIEGKVSAAGFDLWIKKLKPIHINEDTLVFLTPDEMARDTVLRNYTNQITTAVKKHFNVGKINFVLECDSAEYIEKWGLKTDEDAENGFDKPEQDLAYDNPFNPRYTFENFVVGTTNQMIYAAARAVAEQPSVRFNPLFIYGGVGLGKTHILHAIGNFVYEKRKGKCNLVYVTSEQFANDFYELLQHSKEKGMVEFRRKYRLADVLLVDDIQFIMGKDKLQEEIFHTFNDLFLNDKQIILSSDRPPKEFNDLEERLKSRFSSGLIQEIATPDMETRMMIIQKKIELEGYQFEEETIPVLAERLERFNVREIEGVLSKLYFFANLHGKAVVDMATAEEMLAKSHELDVSVGRIVTTDKILDAVCRKTNISREEILGKKRNKEFAEARQICIYLMWKNLNMPMLAIAKLFNRDHTTAIHSRDKITELIKTNKKMKKLVNEIENMANKC